MPITITRLNPRIVEAKFLWPPITFFIAVVILWPLDRVKSGRRDMDRRNIAIATVLVLVIVVAAALKMRKKAGEGFLAGMVYNPCFIDPLGTSRYTCKGYTSGVPPSIETEQEGGWLCPGELGVPP